MATTKDTTKLKKETKSLKLEDAAIGKKTANASTGRKIGRDATITFTSNSATVTENRAHQINVSPISTENGSKKTSNKTQKLDQKPEQPKQNTPDATGENISQDAVPSDVPTQPEIVQTQQAEPVSKAKEPTSTTQQTAPPPPLDAPVITAKPATNGAEAKPYSPISSSIQKPVITPPLTKQRGTNLPNIDSRQPRATRPERPSILSRTPSTSRFKSKTATKKVLFYSGASGFLHGLLSPRDDQRAFAIEQTAAPRTQPKTKPNNPKRKKQNAREKRRELRTPLQKPKPNKLAVGLGLLTLGVTSPLALVGYAGWKITKNKKKENRPPIQINHEGKATITRKRKKTIKIPPPKFVAKKPNIYARTTVGLLKTASLFTAPGLLFFGGKKIKKVLSPSKAPEKQKKTATTYQKDWNKKKIEEAQVSKKYNRFSLLKKILDSKAVKYGKYVVAPIPSAAIDTYHFIRRPTNLTKPQSQISNRRIAPTSPSQRPRRQSINPMQSNPFQRKKPTNLAEKATQEVAKKAVSAVFLNPVVLTGLAFVFGFFFVVAIVLFANGTPDEVSALDPETGGGGTTPGGSNSNPITGLTLSITGPTQVNDCEDVASSACIISYTITYSYVPQGSIKLEDITIYNQLPTNTSFLSAGPAAIHNETNKITSWKLSDTANASPLTITLKPNANNIRVNNSVYALAIPAGSGILAPSSDNLIGIFDAAAQLYNVPSALTRAIAKTESGAHDNYTNTDVAGFNQIGWFSGLADDAPSLPELPDLIRRGYAYNTCAFPKNKPICPGSDVRGITQFLSSTWDSVKTRIPTVSGAEGDRRYVTDAVYGQARHTRDIIEKYDADFGFSNNPTDFTEAQVKAIATSYCGGNPFANINVPACGDGAYDDNVWNYYQELKATQN